jgi:hypothetical protein
MLLNRELERITILLSINQDSHSGTCHNKIFRWTWIQNHHIPRLALNRLTDNLFKHKLIISPLREGSLNIIHKLSNKLFLKLQRQLLSIQVKWCRRSNSKYLTLKIKIKSWEVHLINYQYIKEPFNLKAPNMK